MITDAEKVLVYGELEKLYMAQGIKAEESGLLYFVGEMAKWPYRADQLITAIRSLCLVELQKIKLITIREALTKRIFEAQQRAEDRAGSLDDNEWKESCKMITKAKAKYGKEWWKHLGEFQEGEQVA